MYKRNQVEEALARGFAGSSAKPSIDLRTRAKRLLDLDRSLGRKARSTSPEEANYAFFSEDSPGKGVEVWFSEYEAFALSLGLRLLQHEWPQGFAVATLRRLRPKLEQQHKRFMKQDPSVLFDQERILKNARPGDVYFGNTDPVVLTIVSAPAERAGEMRTMASVCRGMKEVAEFTRSQRAQSTSMLELVSPAHALSELLKRTSVRKRGRS